MKNCSNCNKLVEKIVKTFCYTCYARFIKYGDPNFKKPNTSNANLVYNFSDRQKDVMIGGLLGDSALEMAKTSKFPRMKIMRAIKDEKYLLWQYDLFKDLCTENNPYYETRYDKRDSKYRDYVSFRTRAFPCLLPYYEEWYPNRGEKIVPESLIITPLVAAIWFADDGCFTREGTALTVKLASDSFHHDGNVRLSRKLNEALGCKYPIYKKEETGNLWFIKASSVPALTFYQYIEPVYNFHMERKINNWKDEDYNFMCQKFLK